MSGEAGHRWGISTRDQSKLKYIKQYKFIKTDVRQASTKTKKKRANTGRFSRAATS